MALSTPKARWNTRGQKPKDHDVTAETYVDVGVGQIRIDPSGYVTVLPEDATVEIWYGFQPGQPLKSVKPDETVSVVKGGGWKMSRGSAIVINLSTGTLGVSWAM